MKDLTILIWRLLIQTQMKQQLPKSKRLRFSRNKINLLNSVLAQMQNERKFTIKLNQIENLKNKGKKNSFF